MRASVAVAVAILALGAVSAGTGTGAAFDEHIARLIGTPTPVGPAEALSDRWSWEITLADPTRVLIEAESPAHSPFYLTSSCNAGLVSVPSSHDARLCSKPGTWRVDVDPAGGVAIDITVRFRGHIGDINGAPAGFTLTRTSADEGCVVPGVCLP